MIYQLKTLAGGIMAMLCAAFAMPALAAADTWLRVESDHFVVYSNVNAKAAQAYAKRLEQYRYVLGAMYGMTGEDLPEPKLDIYFVRTQSDLRLAYPKMSNGVLGFVRPCSGGINAYALYSGDAISKEAATRQDENQSQTVIFHEYAHQFMFLHSTDSYPRWFVEGFAEFYGTAAIDDEKAVVGMAWSARVYDLVNDHFSFELEPILRDTEVPKDKEYSFYAQSWLLTHWILSDPARVKLFFTYIEARNRGDDPVTAFESVFGLPAKALGKTLRDYLNGKDLQATVYRMRNMPAPNVAVTTLPASADKLALWDSVSSTCPFGDKDLLDKITREAARYPGDDYAIGVKARADIMIGDEAQALAYYRGYTSVHPNDAKGFYWLGLTEYLMAMHDKLIPGETRESQIRLARAAFTTSYKLEPTDPVNLYSLSLTAVPGPSFPDESSLNAAIEAHLLSPSISTYAVNAASLLLIKGRLPEAREMLVPLGNNPHGGAYVERIRAIIAAIDKGATQEEVKTLLDKLNAPEPESDGTPPDPKKP